MESHQRKGKQTRSGEGDRIIIRDFRMNSLTIFKKIQTKYPFWKKPYLSIQRTFNIPSQNIASPPQKRPNTQYNTMTTTTPKQVVYRMQAIGHNYDGIVFDVGSNQTLATVMRFVCSKWLNIIRNGDGLVDDHLWHVRGPQPSGGKISTKENDIIISSWDDWYDHAASLAANEPLSKTTKLQSINHLIPGRSLTIEYDFGHDARFTLVGRNLTTGYDFGHTTKFEINLMAILTKNRNDEEGVVKTSKYPRLVPLTADTLVKNFCPHETPSYLPSLDVLFPNANLAMFQSGERWVCPFPSSPSNGGFIGGEFHRFADVVFLPAKCSSLYEALMVFDSVMKRHPEEEAGDRYYQKCRMAFPAKLTKAKESKYEAYRDDPCRKTIKDMIPNKQVKSVYYCQHIVVTRIKQMHKDRYPEFVIAQMFPHCAKAYGKGLWASYRHGKVIIGEGNDQGGENRGVPKNVYAQVPYNKSVKSLHNFLCVCEGMFEHVEAQRKYQSLSKNSSIPFRL